MAIINEYPDITQSVLFNLHNAISICSKKIVSLFKFMKIWFINGKSSFVLFFKNKQNFFTFLLNEIILNVWILICIYLLNSCYFSRCQIMKNKYHPKFRKTQFLLLVLRRQETETCKVQMQRWSAYSATSLALPRKDFSLCLTICGNYQRKLGHITFWSYVS